MDAVPPAAAVTVAVAGVNVRPAAALACQVTVAGTVPAELSTRTSTVDGCPGASRTCPGCTVTKARVVGGKRTGPAPNDGGASSRPVPRCVSGVAARLKSSRVAPRSGSGSQLCPVGRPLIRNACTYGRSAAAPGASMTMRRPEPASISACGNSGEPRTSSGTPGVCGYSPSAAHTYQELIAPTSSLPGSPPGVAWYSCVMMRRTVAWVFHGWPRLS